MKRIAMSYNGSLFCFIVTKSVPALPLESKRETEGLDFNENIAVASFNESCITAVIILPQALGAQQRFFEVVEQLKSKVFCG